MSKHNNKKVTKGRREYVQTISHIRMKNFTTGEVNPEKTSQNTVRTIKHLVADTNVSKTLKHYSSRYLKRMDLLNQIVEKQYAQQVKYQRLGYCTSNK